MSTTADRELATSRVLSASPEAVFAAFADPLRLARWWGPKGFTSTFHEFDLRPGGAWRFILHGPADYHNESVFVEVTRPERIVLDHVSKPHFRLTLTLAAEGTGTRLGWHMLFGTAAECAAVKRFAVGANEENLDRLAAELTRTA